MNEFFLIDKYLKPLSLKSKGAFKLTDDIYFDKNKNLGISTDTYVEGIHFIDSKDPNKFLKKILRSSLSDLYCKGLKPKSYLLSLSLNKSVVNHKWLNKIKKILQEEQKKFKISLVGGDTTYSSNLVITITVLGESKKNPVLRKGASANNDIYVTGNLGDSYLGLNVIKKKIDLGKFNNFFKKKYYYPNLATRLHSYLHQIATASIDISDGLAQDLKHLCNQSNSGALINLNLLPLSPYCKKLIKAKKINIKNIFSKGDDYQILFASKKMNRSKIINLSKKLSLKISRIGLIKKDKKIVFEYNNTRFNLNSLKMGYTHIF